MSVQFLKDSNDNVAYAVIPIDDYKRLMAAAENDDDAFDCLIKNHSGFLLRIQNMQE